MYMQSTQARIVEAVPEGADLADGEVAVRIGCNTCPHAIDLVMIAEAGDALTKLGSETPRYVQTNQAGWKRSGSVACSTLIECPHADQVLGASEKFLPTENETNNTLAHIATG